jgi:hypothetical protein
MGLDCKRVGLTLGMLMLGAGPALAQAPAANGTPVSQVSTPAPSLVPADFAVPTLVEAAGFKLVPLGPEHVKIDLAAYMSSIEHLQKTFSRSTSWPHEGISDADAMQDMLNEQARFNGRKSFAYAVLTPDGRRERGSVYVSASPVEGYDAMVRMWVIKADYDAGFDAELYAWIVNWVRKEWPFAKVAYPGRAIAWGTWDPQVAASKARKAAQQQKP